MLKSRTMLLTGSHEATDEFLAAAMPSLRLPVRRYACASRLALPRPAGTLVLDDVEALETEQQEHLLRWLDDAQRAEAQAIAVTATSLYSRVQAGLFSSALYYRLNALYVEIGV